MNAPTTRLPELDVLLVEDDPLDRETAERFLRLSGHRVLSCEDGLAALDAIAARPFDVILMDIGMPRLNGVDAARRIRALPDRRKARTPILALTAGASPAQVDSYLAAGINEIIRKPLTADSIDGALMPFFALPADAPAPGGTAQPDSEAAPIVDGAHLALLAEAIEAPRLKELYAVARQSMEEAAASLRQHWQAGDGTAAGRDAHRLAGVASNFGCVALAALARAIETACREGGDGRLHEAALQPLLTASLAALSFDP